MRGLESLRGGCWMNTLLDKGRTLYKCNRKPRVLMKAFQLVGGWNA
ncbi:hypothetical protein V3C99_011644 [Haemonchus contortus]